LLGSFVIFAFMIAKGEINAHDYQVLLPTIFKAFIK
jgi:hypothetical protein